MARPTQDERRRRRPSRTGAAPRPCGARPRCRSSSRAGKTLSQSASSADQKTISVTVDLRTLPWNEDGSAAMIHALPITQAGTVEYGITMLEGTPTLSYGYVHETCDRGFPNWGTMGLSPGETLQGSYDFEGSDMFYIQVDGRYKYRLDVSFHPR